MKAIIEVKETYTRVNGYQIRYVEKGKGPPLILIHGLGASIEWWKGNIEPLSQNHRVIAFDFLGFGYSTKPEEEYNIDLATRFMRSFLDVFDLPKASLVGNSIGGLIALFAALHMPERIDRVILVDNAGFGQELSVILRWASVFPIGELALSIRTRQTVRMLLARIFYDPKKIPPDLVNSVLKIFDQPRAREACLQVLRYGVNRKGLREEIWSSVLAKVPSITHPTLIIWGSENAIAPLSQAHQGKRLIKNSKLCVFEKCGHVPQVEWPEKFNQLVLSFLKS